MNAFKKGSLQHMGRQKPAKLPFTDRQFVAIVLPLFIDRLLQLVVGVADTFVISFAGEQAVSGVSLVNQFNNVFIFVSTALASGGAVIISQYIGSKNRDKAGEAGSQLLMAATVFSLLVSALIYMIRSGILHFLFGHVEQAVMDAALTYLAVTVLSYVGIAVYDAGAAMYRSMGRTRVTMYVSLIYNMVNLVGNVIGVFVLRAGVLGVAWPTVISRLLGAVIITVLCFNEKNAVVYQKKSIFCFDPEMLKRVLNVAVPNGVENGVFQFVKVALSSIVSLFGTSQIAANGIAQNFWSLSNAFGNAGSPAFTTVIGQCMGDENEEAAEYYFHRFDKILALGGLIWNVILQAMLPFVLHFYAVSDETRSLIFWAVLVHNAFGFWLFPYWNSTAAGLRAAGDIRFTMVTAVFSTVCVRLVLSYLLGVSLGMGLKGVVVAMIADWVVRGGILIWRVRTGKWKSRRLI